MMEVKDRSGRFNAPCGAMALVLVAQAPTLAEARDNWRIDPTRTHIGFAIDAVGFPRTQGHFRRFDGRVSVDFDEPSKSSVAFHVQSGSVDVGSASFGDYLRSPAFLDADHHPSIDFVSTSVQRISDHAVRVSGDLTLLGVTKLLSVDVAVVQSDSGGKQRLDFQAETHIDRLAFGMNSGYPLVSRDVRLVISSEADEL
jgi:polyisoprenoid-binding protein YceI